ncbi:MAG: hypothetical protein CM15mV118_480 [uncultured marine virus]|nr:MAG: hypothetical protein CM15mV118_480 [uncultured marine virus]
MIIEIGQNLKNQLLIIDLLNLNFRKVKFKKIKIKLELMKKILILFFILTIFPSFSISDDYFLSLKKIKLT